MKSNLVKVRTKIEYVKVTVKEAKEFHVDELFFYWGDDNYVALKDVDSQTFIINQHKLRRKVKTEIKTEKRWVVVNVKNNSDWAAVRRHRGMPFLKIEDEKQWG